MEFKITMQTLLSLSEPMLSKQAPHIPQLPLRLGNSQSRGTG